MDAKLLSRICSRDFIGHGWNLILFNPVVLSLSLSLSLSLCPVLLSCSFSFSSFLSEKPIEDRTIASVAN